MQEFERRALELGAPNGKIDWDSATYHFLTGAQAAIAAEKRYRTSDADEKHYIDSRQPGWREGNN